MQKASLKVVAILSLAALSCGSQTGEQPAASPEEGAPPASPSAPEQGGEARVPEPEGDPIPEATTPVGAWGVAIAVPPGARAEHEAQVERHTLYVSDQVVVKLFRMNIAAPASLAEATKSWDQEKELKKLGEGSTPHGGFYAIRTFKERVGVASMEAGPASPTSKQVSRVYAVIPLGPDTRVVCTGYIDKGAESAADPDIQAARKICLSMRKL